MDARLFLRDLEAKPEALSALADRLEADDPWAPVVGAERLVFVGMGSSHYAASLAAARLRAQGLDAVAELASSELLPAPREGTLVIAVSAGGGSRETEAAVHHYQGRCPIVVLTNRPDSALAAQAKTVVPLLAGVEAGGVACRSFQHTLALLLALEDRLCPSPSPSPGLGRETSRVPGLVRAAATASADLLQRRSEWLPEIRRLLIGPHGTQVAAPARRLSSAQQSALMLREGPRLPAVGCETGDWSHVEVYLTLSSDYRLLLYTGSTWQAELLRWTIERGSAVVAVGAEVPEAALSLRYPGDGDDEVALLTETLVAELLAAEVWARPRR